MKVTELASEDQSAGRERLLDAAQALFAEHGFTDVSINEIARAAGMTRSAPYYHFRNKEELYAAVLVRQIAGMFEEIEKAVAAAGSLREQLLAVVDVAMIAHGSSFGRSKEDFRSHVSPEIREVVAAQLPTPATVFSPIFQRAHEEGAFARLDPDSAGRVFFMMLIGYMELTEKDGECAPGPFRVIAPEPEEFIDAFLHGI